MRSGRHRRDFQAAKASGPGVSVRGASRGTATGHRAAVFSEKRRWRSRTRPRRGQPTSRRNRKRTRESPRPGKCYCSSGHKQRSAGIAALLSTVSTIIGTYSAPLVHGRLAAGGWRAFGGDAINHPSFGATEFPEKTSLPNYPEFPSWCRMVVGVTTATVNGYVF